MEILNLQTFAVTTWLYQVLIIVLLGLVFCNVPYWFGP